MFHWSMTVPITVPETIMEVEQFCPWKATGSKQVSYSFHAWRGWRGWRPSQAFAAIATVQLSDLNHMPSKYFRQAKHGKALEFSFFLCSRPPGAQRTLPGPGMAPWMRRRGDVPGAPGSHSSRWVSRRVSRLAKRTETALESRWFWSYICC